jgi:hypothetical protein
MLLRQPKEESERTGNGRGLVSTVAYYSHHRLLLAIPKILILLFQFCVDVFLFLTYVHVLVHTGTQYL